MFLMRMLVVFLDRTVPASKKAKPACRKNTTKLLMRMKKVSTVSLISCISSSMDGADGVVIVDVDGDVDVDRDVDVDGDVEEMTVVKFSRTGEEEEDIMVLEVIFVTFSMMAVDISYFSVLNICSMS